MHNDKEYMTEMFEACREDVESYTHLVLCPWGKDPLQDNNIRTLNPFYQFMIHSISIGILDDIGVDYISLKGCSDIKEMTREIVSVITKE